MKGAIASVEIFVFEAAAATAARPGPPDARSRRSSLAALDPATPPSSRPRRLSLVIGVPERAPSGDLWHCRVALADLHRPQTVAGRDSVEALFLAVEHARAWLAALHAEGFALCRDRAGAEPFSIP